MTQTATETQTVVVDRELPHPPEKVWRALSQPHYLQEWLMENDFQPVVGHRFNFRASWGSVDCEVRVLEPNRILSMSWSAMGIESVVTWTLTATPTGTHLRVEQTGFRSDQGFAINGARQGWPRFLEALERTVTGMPA